MFTPLFLMCVVCVSIAPAIADNLAQSNRFPVGATKLIRTAELGEQPHVGMRLVSSACENNCDWEETLCVHDCTSTPQSASDLITCRLKCWSIKHACEWSCRRMCRQACEHQHTQCVSRCGEPTGSVGELRCLDECGTRKSQCESNCD